MHRGVSVGVLQLLFVMGLSSSLLLLLLLCTDCVDTVGGRVVVVMLALLDSPSLFVSLLLSAELVCVVIGLVIPLMGVEIVCIISSFASLSSFVTALSLLVLDAKLPSLAVSELVSVVVLLQRLPMSVAVVLGKARKTLMAGMLITECMLLLSQLSSSRGCHRMCRSASGGRAKTTRLAHTVVFS